MHILIVDDEVLARQRLSRLLSAIEGYHVVGEAANGADAVAAVAALDPDLVLMDVRMPGIDGLQAAKLISDMGDPPAIIFCTAYDQYALAAFDVDAAGYLVKPVQSDQLLAALEKAQRINKLQRSILSTEKAERPPIRSNVPAKTRLGVELIPLASIYCFIADQKYVTVMHSKGETLIDDTLKELEGEFAARFVRVHRNALVAIAEINGMERSDTGHYEVVLKSTDFRPMVSRRHLSNIKTILNTL
ncbi:MAG: two-component system response regulator AlgR [Lentisphaeria bacterium]|jgi:two-component system response regulator AlgR